MICYDEPMNNEFLIAMEKLANDWPNLNWNFKPIKNLGLVSQWQGESDEDIMIVVFKGKEIDEPYHKQEFFFIDYAYQNGYDVLSQQSNHSIHVNQNDYYISLHKRLNLSTIRPISVLLFIP